MSFLSDYFEISDDSVEVAVQCPFTHYTESGIPYLESHPSAHVNTSEGLFHCKACNAGYNEAQFISHVLDCSYIDAKKIQLAFNTSEDIITWNKYTQLSEATKHRAEQLGISPEVITALNIKTPTGSQNKIAFPVFMFGHLVDIRTYDPGGTPKIKSRLGATSGLIIPFDIWRNSETKRVTIICAGEKDMAIARSKGFNAITITGGESAIPKQGAYFKDRPVVIAYDNDGTGKAGAVKLAIHLLKYTSNIKILTKMYETCVNKGEDVTDYFTKYNKTKEDFIKMIKETSVYLPDPKTLESTLKTVTLREASTPENLNKMLHANIQVVAVADTTFATPAEIVADKFKLSGEKDTMAAGECRTWELKEDTCQDILHMIDNNFKEDAIKKNIKSLLKIPFTERNLRIKVLSKKTIFKLDITDLFETSDKNVEPMIYTAYCINHKLESGKKYGADFKLVPHPYKGQQLIMIITNVVEANDSVSNFKLNDTTKQHLSMIKNLEGSVEEKITLMTEKVKGLLGYNGNNTLIQTIDLAYHTVLGFNFGSFKNIRGYLDTLVVGESRVGKSSTADTLRKTYELGIFTSLAGNSATIPGLIGGSNKTQSGFQTRAGIIPQQHKGLIIFEEFGKSNANITKELTDIRSSNEVRITRVSGTITMPAAVRMISLTNVKNTNGMIKPIASYPNGISIITELVDTAEDIARYDLITILSDRGNNQVDPYWEPSEPFNNEIYKTRVRWVWSRTPEQVIIDKETGLYIINAANTLNKDYECHIKLFGTEAWKKISRLSIAIAGYLVSTDDSYENIIVKPEHVDYAVKFFKTIYDNETFKLKEYVQFEKRYTTIDEEGIANLQDIYNKNPSIVLQLEQCAEANKNMLSAATGLSNDDLNKALNRLTKGLFIRFQNHNIVPTERFRLGVAKINKNTVVTRVGE